MEISDIPSIPPSATTTTGIVASAYTFAGFPLSDIVSILTIGFILLQVFAYSPRIWNTVTAWYRKVFKRDSTLFDALSEHTDKEG